MFGYPTLFSMSYWPSANSLQWIFFPKCIKTLVQNVIYEHNLNSFYLTTFYVMNKLWLIRSELMWPLGHIGKAIKASWYKKCLQSILFKIRNKFKKKLSDSSGTVNIEEWGKFLQSKKQDIQWFRGYSFGNWKWNRPYGWCKQRHLPGTD